MMTPILTERLILRSWQASDLLAFTALNQDPKVMEFFPKLLSEDEVKMAMQRYNQHIEKHGFGLFACELKQTGELIGFVGLNRPSFSSYFTPCVEVGWRLAFAHWGQGYATEAARKVIDLGFNTFSLLEIVSFTTPKNTRSIALMQRLGMTHNPAEQFHHPNLPINHPLSLHVLYRLEKANYLSQIK